MRAEGDHLTRSGERMPKLNQIVRERSRCVEINQQTFHVSGRPVENPRADQTNTDS